MALITDNKNGTLSVQLTNEEQRTITGLPSDQFQHYITLWLAEKAPSVLAVQFSQLSDQDKTDVRIKLDTAQPVKIKNTTKVPEVPIG